MPTAAEIANTFAAAQIAVGGDQITRLVIDLAAHGNDLGRLIGSLHAAPDAWVVSERLTVALRYRSALRREADPAYLVQCLRTEAQDLDAQADDQIGEAEQDLIVVSYRRRRWGDDDATASEVEARAKAARELAADLAAQASERRIAANRIERRLGRRNELVGVVIDIAQAGRAA